MMNIKELIEYEVANSWIGTFISFDWGQEILANYIARKTSRKYYRHKALVQGMQEREEITRQEPEEEAPKKALHIVRG